MKSEFKVFDEARNIQGIIFEGRLDAASRDIVKTELHQALDSATSLIVVDLDKVTFIDSSGLSALVSGLRVAKEHDKDIILVGLNKQAQMVFHLTMMDRVFVVYLSLQDALDNLTAQ